jgi:hypothetical protein
MALSPQQQQIAHLLYGLAAPKVGAARAKEFVAAAFAESGLNPHADNRSTHAHGLYQLLSSGYRQRAQQLGGIDNPRANALAILPDYIRYWQSHPHAAAGQAGAAVERSGQGAAFYAKPLPLVSGQTMNQRFGAGVATSPSGVRPLGLATGPDKLGELQQLMQGVQSHDPAAVIGLLRQRAAADAQQIVAARQPKTPLAGSVGAGAQTMGATLGRVTLAKGADRAGVKTSRAVLSFVARIAGLAGQPLTIGTGSNHSQMTVDHNVSDHWSGHAADIPATGAELVRLGRLALIAAGASRSWAMKQKGGLYNINGHQVIFNTHEGGDHTNHLHVSAH